jgi:hypothetical protein
MTAVAYRLRRADRAYPTAALLLLSDRPADLLAFLARLGADPWPVVYAVPGGFLVKPPRPGAGAHAPAVRLRALADKLYLPADAELEPTLLPDEAVGLARSRGIVFLPGGRVLGFRVDARLTPAELLSAPRLPGRAWEPLPARAARAEQLRAVLLNRPGEAVDQIVDRGGEGVGGEDPLPEPPGPAANVAGHAAAALGRGLLALANVLRWRGLARLAAGLIGSALSRVPRISESLLGKQEAALRALLREFREGNLERALRRALPLGDPGSPRGAVPLQSAELPRHSGRFSLADLLADGRGRVGTWFGGGNVAHLLAQEYRKAAAAAAARGDHRRAAFIYGKLLRDYRMAAAALERGGLHHDAAIIYLEKVKDHRAAAKAFAAAGELDRALALFRERGEYALAGDLLRDAGDEDGALAEYTLAAAVLAGHDDHFAAGQLMQNRARRADLAVAHYAAGWKARPAINDVPCLLRLADLYADRESLAELVALADEADAFFAGPGRETEASQFYDDLARVADRPHLNALRDDLRDRALVGISGKIRRRAAEERLPGTVVSSLLGRSGLWDAALVSDAEFAFKAALPRGAVPKPVRTQAADDRFRLYPGTVTAACASLAEYVLFVGFTDGALAAFVPGAAKPPKLGCAIARGGGEVMAVATNAWGRMVVTLSRDASGQWWVNSYVRDPAAGESLRFEQRHRRPLFGEGPFGISPIYYRGATGVNTIALRNGPVIDYLESPDLVPVSAGHPRNLQDPTFAAASWPRPGGSRLRLVICDRNELRLLDSLDDNNWADSVPVGWSPALPAGGRLHAPQLACLYEAPPDALELAGISATGEVCCSEVHAVPMAMRPGIMLSLQATRRLRPEQGRFRAATLVSHGRLAAVREAGVVWARVSGQYLAVTATTAASLPDAVACFHSANTKELLVVCSGGDVVRVPAPE